MAGLLSYTISVDFPNQAVAGGVLKQEIITASLPTAVVQDVTSDFGTDTCSVVFDVQPTAGEEATVDAVVAAHLGVPAVDLDVTDVPIEVTTSGGFPKARISQNLLELMLNSSTFMTLSRSSINVTLTIMGGSNRAFILNSNLLKVQLSDLTNSLAFEMSDPSDNALFHIFSAGGFKAFGAGQVTGALSQGAPGTPAPAYLIGGGPYTTQMAVQTNTNNEVGTWNDITAEMVSESGSAVPILAGAGVNNTVYVGGNEPFRGIQVDVTVAAALGLGAIQGQFWNGAAWQRVNVLATDAASPYGQYSSDVFTRASLENIRISPISNWASTTLNGQNKFWLRFRVASSIASVPSAESIKLIPVGIHAHADARLEWFGDELPVRSLYRGPGTRYNDLIGSVVSPANVNYTATMLQDGRFNLFSATTANGKGGVLTIPEGLDTTRNLEVELTWAPTLDVAAGDVELQMEYVRKVDGDVLDGSLSGIVVSSIETVPLNSANVSFRSSLELTVVNFLPGEVLAYSIFRDGTAGNPDDTLASSIYLESVAITGHFWR